MPASPPARRFRAALRAPNPATVATLALALVLGGAGGAAAANGGNFLLGKANTETAPASLSNTKGTPLKLLAPANVAPLSVNRKTLIPNLNANFVGGLTFDQLATQGGDGFTPLNAFIPIDGDGEEIASTGHLAPGTCYVTATALVDVATGDDGVLCTIVKGSNPAVPITQGGTFQVGTVQAAETIAVSVTAGDTLQEWCQSGGFNGSEVADGGITAIRVLFFSGTPPASTGTPHKAIRRHLPAPQRAHTSPAR
jgi:hypothetical protein